MTTIIEDGESFIELTQKNSRSEAGSEKLAGIFGTEEANFQQ